MPKRAVKLASSSEVCKHTTL